MVRHVQFLECLLAAERDQLLAHDQNAQRKIDVCPAQAHGLAST
jgi:hypothetical protein